MKTNLLPLAAALSLVVGCGGDSTSDSSPGQNPIDAPAEYAGQLARSQNLAEKVVDTSALNQAVQLFHAQEGRFPKDLNELVTEKYLPRMPEPPRGMKFEYDAKTGEVKVVSQ